MSQICKLLYRSENHFLLFTIVANSKVVYVNISLPNNLANRSLGRSSKTPKCKPNKLSFSRTIRTFRRMTLKLFLEMEKDFKAIWRETVKSRWIVWHLCLSFWNTYYLSTCPSKSTFLPNIFSGQLVFPRNYPDFRVISRRID